MDVTVMVALSLFLLFPSCNPHNWIEVPIGEQMRVAQTTSLKVSIESEVSEPGASHARCWLNIECGASISRRPVFDEAVYGVRVRTMWLDGECHVFVFNGDMHNVLRVFRIHDGNCLMLADVNTTSPITVLDNGDFLTGIDHASARPALHHLRKQNYFAEPLGNAP